MPLDGRAYNVTPFLQGQYGEFVCCCACEVDHTHEAPCIRLSFFQSEIHENLSFRYEVRLPREEAIHLLRAVTQCLHFDVNFNYSPEDGGLSMSGKVSPDNPDYFEIDILLQGSIHVQQVAVKCDRAHSPFGRFGFLLDLSNFVATRENLTYFRERLADAVRLC
jgi:hypothetical protein